MCAAVDVHYLRTGGAGGSHAGRRYRLRTLLAECTAVVPQVPPYRPGEFYLHELPPLRAVLDDLTELGLLVVDGYADLSPDGRPGLGGYALGEFGIPVIGAAKSRFRTAIHAVLVVRGSSMRPLFVAAAGMLSADAGDLVRRMADRYRLPDALRRADTRSRVSRIEAQVMTDGRILKPHKYPAQARFRALFLRRSRRGWVNCHRHRSALARRRPVSRARPVPPRARRHSEQVPGARSMRAPGHLKAMRWSCVNSLMVHLDRVRQPDPVAVRHQIRLPPASRRLPRTPRNRCRPQVPA